MGKILRIFIFAFVYTCVKPVSAQVSSYLFAQSNDTYVPIVADAGTTPANIFVSAWTICKMQRQ